MRKETIQHDGVILAKIIYKQNLEEGAHFYTPDENLLQIGKLVHPKGKTIKAHKHSSIRIEADQPLQEVLYIEKGKIKVAFYSVEDKWVCSRILNKGDTLLLINGGHSFEILENTMMLEVKQGPYAPDNRKDLKAEV